MKIKYTSSPTYNITLATVFIYTGMLNIISIPILGTDAIQNLIVFLATMFLFANTMLNESMRRKTFPYSRFFYITLIYLAVFTAAHCVYSYVVYSEGFDSLYTTVRQVWLLLYFLPFMYIIHAFGGYDRLLKDILAMTLVFMTIKTLRAFLYNFTGITVLNAMSYSLRHGRMRMSLNAFGGIVFIFCVYKIMELSRKSKEYYYYLAATLFIFFYEIYINMTRMYIISFFVTFAVMVFVKRRPKGARLFVIILLFIAVAVLAATGVIGAFLETFSESNEEFGASTLGRSYSMSYFSEVANSQPVFGLSFLVPDTPLRTNLFFSSTGTAYLDDLGIVNMYFRYGILGIILTVLIFGRMIYCAVMALIAKSQRAVIIVGIITFIALTCVSLCVFDGQRILTVPLYWAILEYEYYVCANQQRKKFTPRSFVRIK